MVMTRSQRVLAALCAEAERVRGTVIPLRRIAVMELDGDWDEALRTLEALDRAGYIRADLAGWIEGWVTERGRSAHRAMER
jgi:hypothetical protein